MHLHVPIATLLASLLSAASAAVVVPPLAPIRPASIALPAAVALQDTQRIGLARNGSRPAQRGGAQQFSGQVRIDPLFDTTDASRASGATVTFEPRARTAWHTHPRGQTLIVTAGVGRVAQWGGGVQEIRPGDVVRIPPGVKHWHGAAPTVAMTHVAIQEARDGTVVEWLEQVSDEQYRSPAATR